MSWEDPAREEEEREETMTEAIVFGFAEGVARGIFIVAVAVLLLVALGVLLG